MLLVYDVLHIHIVNYLFHLIIQMILVYSMHMVNDIHDYIVMLNIVLKHHHHYQSIVNNQHHDVLLDANYFYYNNDVISNKINNKINNDVCVIPIRITFYNIIHYT